NRIHGVDEAILARCAAVIDYLPPTTNDARQIWQTMAAEHGVTLEATLVEELLVGFEGITPRDIKMVLRLALRMARHRDVELSMEVFRSEEHTSELQSRFD